MLSGDDVIAEEATALLGPIETAVTKKSLGFHSAQTLMPEASYALIGQKVSAALGRLGDFRPFRMQGPVTLEIVFKNYMPEVARFLQFATHYRVDLTP